MSLSSWLGRRGRILPAGKRSGLRQSRLHLEALEDRSLLSTFSVLNLNDSGAGSLRQAVLDANAVAGTDLIDFARDLRGEIKLTTGELTITDDLTIDGPGASKLTISGNHASRAFSISGAGTDVAIDDLTIADGLARGAIAMGGGILNHGAHLSVSRMTFTNNRATGDVGPTAIAGGGAIANVFGGALTIVGGTFTGNKSSSPTRSAGGAILNDAGSTLTIDSGTFTGNTTTGRQDAHAVLGAAGGALANLGESTAVISRSSFSGNRAQGGDEAPGPFQAGIALGGAISNSQSLVGAGLGGSSLTVSASRFQSNEARGGHGGAGRAGPGGGGAGGAISNEQGSTANVTDSEFRGNRAIAGRGDRSFSNLVGGLGGEGAGGAIENFRAFLAVERSTFIENVAMGGQGGSSLALGGGGGRGNGGAISSFNLLSFPGVPATVHLNSVTMIGNQAIAGTGGDGGAGRGGNGGVAWGGSVVADGTLIVSGSTFDGNQATGGTGGGGATPGNGGAAQGGAIANLAFVYGGGRSNLTVSNSLLKNNQANGGFGNVGGVAQGGGIFNGADTVGAQAFAVVSGTTIVSNQANGGGGLLQGGDGQGGGIFNDGVSALTLLGSSLTRNRANGGAGPTPGNGVGGGIYNLAGGTVCVDLLADIHANDASTSHDDVFGDLCYV